MTTASECWCSDGWSAGAGSGRRPRRGGGAGVDRARRPHRRHAGVPRRARRTPSDPRPRPTPSTAFERSRQCRGRSAQGPHCPRNPRRALRGHTGQAHQPFQEIPDEFNARVDAFHRGPGALKRSAGVGEVVRNDLIRIDATLAPGELVGGGSSHLRGRCHASAPISGMAAFIGADATDAASCLVSSSARRNGCRTRSPPA
jgi:hypothetical protein